MLRILFKMAEDPRGREGDDREEMVPGESPVSSELELILPVEKAFSDCKRLWEAFVDSDFKFDHPAFFDAFQLLLRSFYESLVFLNDLPNEVRQKQANHFLTECLDSFFNINSFVELKALSFEETVLSRVFCGQIETRLRILAGSEYRQNWEGPNITGDNRPVIEGGQS